jgi:hypothetical protein
MITVKVSQKLFTYAEVTNLTGICAEHLESLARRHRLGSLHEPRRLRATRLTNGSSDRGT